MLSKNVPQQASYNLRKLCGAVSKRTYAVSHPNTHFSFLSDNLFLSEVIYSDSGDASL